jgi:hypothetical protein
MTRLGFSFDAADDAALAAPDKGMTSYTELKLSASTE